MLLHSVMALTLLAVYTSRKHFLICLETGKMSLFPTTQDQRTVVKPAKEQTIDVYCNCRMPHDDKEDMIMCFRCHEWYYGLCVVGGILLTTGNQSQKPSGTVHIDCIFCVRSCPLYIYIDGFHSIFPPGHYITMLPADIT